jgi:hypothetical protein
MADNRVVLATKGFVGKMEILEKTIELKSILLFTTQNSAKCVG